MQKITSETLEINLIKDDLVRDKNRLRHVLVEIYQIISSLGNKLSMMLMLKSDWSSLSLKWGYLGD